MQTTPVVTVFLRHEGTVLLLRRSEAVGSYQGQWGAVTGHAEGDPDAAARKEIREETGINPVAKTALVRRGDPLTVQDQNLDTERVVHPYLFDCETTEANPNEETTAVEWVPATATLRREAVPDLWTAYDRVRPSVETIGTDTEHGSAFLSLRALSVLRDEAALAAESHPAGRAWDELLDLARDLVAARPSMPVVVNRVDRAVARAVDGEATAAALEAAATAGIERALAVDRAAAENAAGRLQGARVATFSRSGTVTTALQRAGPEAVLVAESRPGGEGVAVAGQFAAALPDVPVTLTTDAAFAHQLRAWDADALVVGADALRPDGRVVNKVGTRGAAVAAAHEGIDVVVAAASDKLAVGGGEPDLEPRDRAELTADDRVAVVNSTFDVTPPAIVGAVVTERGDHDPNALGDLAVDYRELTAWRDDSAAGQRR